MKRVALIISLLLLTGSVRAQSQSNIFGTVDDMLNDAAMSARLKSLPNQFVRIQANWTEINPAPGVFNFTNAPSCNDAIISNAATQGRVILFDIYRWPAWVMRDWTNRYANMTAYGVAVLRRWPQIAWLGCWNEPSTAPPLFGNILQGSQLLASPLQLMTEYHALVTCIYNAKQSVNPAVKLDVGKFQDFQDYWPCMLLMKSLGTWAMADLITWHDGYNAAYPALADTVTNGLPVPSAAHKIQQAQALFPGKLVGSDEFYTYGTKEMLQAAKAYRDNGAGLLVAQYLPQPVNPGTLSAIYGTDTNGVLLPMSQAFIGLLTCSTNDFMKPIWEGMGN